MRSGRSGARCCPGAPAARCCPGAPAARAPARLPDPGPSTVSLMRFATIRTSDGTTAARLDGDMRCRWTRLTSGSCWPALRGLAAAARRRRSGPGPHRCPRDASFAPLVPRAAKVLCVGLNYRAHILETGRDLPRYPTLFAKFARTLLGARDDLLLPAVSDRVNWEVELGVVIGRPTLPGQPGRGGGGHRRIHRHQRREHARLAEPYPAVAAGQDVRAEHPGRPVPGHRGSDRRCRGPGGAMRGERGRDAAVAHLRPPVRPGRDRRLCQPGHHPGARRPAAHRHPGRGGDARKPRSTCSPARPSAPWSRASESASTCACRTRPDRAAPREGTG